MGEIFKYKRVAIDFDGTLFEDSSDIFYNFKENIQLKPLADVSEVTKFLKEQGFEILIYTCRPDYHRRYMEDLMIKNNISFDYILFYTKPRVDLYIDDKGFRFENWQQTKEWIGDRL
jgi:phosphoglycolate phosphatase-like HAD superfamily hydrolase